MASKSRSVERGMESSANQLDQRNKCFFPRRKLINWKMGSHCMSAKQELIGTWNPFEEGGV